MCFTMPMQLSYRDSNRQRARLSRSEGYFLHPCFYVKNHNGQEKSLPTYHLGSGAAGLTRQFMPRAPIFNAGDRRIYRRPAYRLQPMWRIILVFPGNYGAGVDGGIQKQAVRSVRKSWFGESHQLTSRSGPFNRCRKDTYRAIV